MTILGTNITRAILISFTKNKEWQNISAYQCRYVSQKFSDHNRFFIPQLQITTTISSIVSNNIFCGLAYNANRFNVCPKRMTPVKSEIRSISSLCYRLEENSVLLARYNSTKPPTASTDSVLSRKDRLKRAVKEYGSTVIIFHVGISLVSLGVCYILVSSGIDMEKVLGSLGVSGGVVSNAGTFVTAYAIHKVFAPVRISITLTATPFIVRYLRRIGFLKKPKA